jgi:hypothetical protein
MGAFFIKYTIYNNFLFDFNYKLFNFSFTFKTFLKSNLYLAFTFNKRLIKSLAYPDILSQCGDGKSTTPDLIYSNKASLDSS